MPLHPAVDPEFRHRLRKLREARGKSIRRLARAAFVSKSTVWNLETGATAPSVAVAKALDAALDADGELAWLVTTEAELANDETTEPIQGLDVDVVRHRDYGGDPPVPRVEIFDTTTLLPLVSVSPADALALADRLRRAARRVQRESATRSGVPDQEQT